MRWNFCLLFLIVSACSVIEIEEPEVSEPGRKEVTVSFDVLSEQDCKSSIDPDENHVEDINIYVFRDGVLVSETYATADEDISIRLVEGQVYDVFALANVGCVHAPLNEDDFKACCRHEISDMEDLDAAVPMIWKRMGMRVTDGMKPVSVCLERTVARFDFSVDKLALDGLEVRSVRLCQSASVLRPFKEYGGGGSRAETVEEVFDGDYATEEDLLKLNSGGVVSFYALENCQGILLPDNPDPSAKIPDMIDCGELCTYLEVGCLFDGSGLLEGEVLYRIYLGLDNCTSFDVRGNSCVNVRLMLTDDGLKEVSWRVDADVSVRDGYASGMITEGMHNIDDLYVGEKILYEVEFSDQLLEYLDGDADGCSLRLMADGVESDGMVAGLLRGEGQLYQTEILFDTVAEGAICLFGPGGEPLGTLEKNVNVALPKIRFSEYSSWLEDEPVEGLSYRPECVINGKGEIVYLYLTDSYGYNLNGARAYAFDSGLFSFEDAGVWVDNTLLPDCGLGISALEPERGAPVASLEGICMNSGTDDSVNQLFADAYAGVADLSMKVSEKNYGMQGGFLSDASILPVKMSLVDNGWAGYADCQMSMVVDNPSAIPLSVSMWQLSTVYNAVDPVDEDYVEQNLRIDRMDVMTGKFNSVSRPLYATGYKFVTDCDEHAYPLRGLEIEDISKAAAYDGYGQQKLFHLADVSLMGHALVASDVSLDDKLDDGSMEYVYIYSEDGWNNVGVWLFSNDRLLSSAGSLLEDYPNVTPLRLERLEERFTADGPVEVCFEYDESLIMYTYTGRGDKYGLNLSVRYSGTAYGYVQTHPKGTWRAEQDNYCSVDFDYTVSGKLLTDVLDYADDGEFRAVLDEVYAHSYKDSDRPLGANAYMHHAHPTSVDCRIDILVEGDDGNELYAFDLNWKQQAFDYYHSQEAKTYSVKFNLLESPYRINVVRHK